MQITKQQWEAGKNGMGVLKLNMLINKQEIKIIVDPDDIGIDGHLLLVNKVLTKFEIYETKARMRIIQDFLNNHNNNWTDDEHPELNEEEFSRRLTLKSIHFISACSIDFFYDERGMMGFHNLVAQSSDGENFDYSSMFG